MNLNNYYLHATGGYIGIRNIQNKIIDILEDGKIKPNILDKYEETPKDIVCLCDIKKSCIGKIKFANSALRDFVLFSPTIVVDRGLEVDSTSGKHIDEVQHIGEIPMDKFKFITFPISSKGEKGIISYPCRDHIARLKIFKENISIIEERFPTIVMKDIFTGQNVNVKTVENEIELCQKKLEKYRKNPFYRGKLQRGEI